MSKQQLGRKGLSLLLAVLMVGNLLFTPALAKTVPTGTPEDRVRISSTDYAIVDGVTETKLTTNNTEGTNQRIGYIVDIDAGDFANGNIQIAAGYMNYQFNTWGLQSVTDQATQYERAHYDKGYKVVAAINGDFFNMTTGAPAGALVMDGKVGHAISGKPYFVITTDGKAEIREASVPLGDDVWQAVAGNYILVKDGVNNVSSEEAYAQASVSRTAIGIRADGSVVIYVTHGSTPPTSCGETYYDIADVLVAQGCVIGLNLDGGGSSTLATVREGTEKLTVQNSPSDGVPRTVSSTLFVVSTVQSDGQFDHASLTPNNEYYTPSLSGAATTVQFEAQGVDKSGAAADLPDASELSWRLASGYESMGEIDDNGLFTAAVGALGEVAVELLHNGSVVGSTTIQIVEPDTVYFESNKLSLDFAQVTDLGLVVRGAGVDLNIKDGDFAWTMDNTTSGHEDEDLGTFADNIFTAHAKADFSLDGSITVTYNGDETLTDTVTVEIGKLPIVALDFEGEYNVGLYDWGAAASFFTDGVSRPYESGSESASGESHYFYYLRPQIWNGSAWANAGDSYWINEVASATQPWSFTDGENYTDSMPEENTVVNLQDGLNYEYDNSLGTGLSGKTFETGTTTDTYGENGQIWVLYGDNALKDDSELENGDVRYAWYVWTEARNWGGSFNAAYPAGAVLGVDGYNMFIWHTDANKSDVENNGFHGEGSGIVTKETGQVRFGNQALKLTYDYRNFVPAGSTKNCNTYYRVIDAVVAQGSPTGLGMWVYAPEGMGNYWFWTRVYYWTGTSWTSSYIHFKAAGAEKTMQYTGINWTGWKYVEADLSDIYKAGAVVDAEHPVQIRSGGELILMTYIPGGTNDGNGNAIVCGSKTAGEFYIDNVRWVYGTTIDDVDFPEILSVTVGDTELSAEETVTVSSNTVSFDVSYTDPQGENWSGIDVEGTQLFLDGSPLNPSAFDDDGNITSVGDFTATADRAQTTERTLANGEHTLRVSITDNFGNVTDQTYRFVVSNPNSKLPTIVIDRETDAELGGDYKINISVGSAADLLNIASVSTRITYQNTTKLEPNTVNITTTDTGSTFYDDYFKKATKNADGTYTDSLGQTFTDVADLWRPAKGTYHISSATQTLGSNLEGIVRNYNESISGVATRVFSVTNATVKNMLDRNDLTLLTFTLPVPSNLKETDNIPYEVTVTITTTDGETYYFNTGELKAELWAYYEIAPEVLVSNENSGVIVVNTTERADEEFTSDNVQLWDTNEQLTGSFTENSFETQYFHNQLAGNGYNIQVRNETDRHYSFTTSVDVVEWSGEKSGHKAYDVTLNPSTTDNTTGQDITWLSSVDGATAKAQAQYMTKEDYQAAYDEAYEDAYDDNYNALYDEAYQTELEKAKTEVENEVVEAAKQEKTDEIYEEAYQEYLKDPSNSVDDPTNPSEEEKAAAEEAAQQAVTEKQSEIDQAGEKAKTDKASEIEEKAKELAEERVDTDAVKAAAETKTDADAIETAFEQAETKSGTATLYSFELGFKGSYVNHVSLTGLTPGTEYVCRVGDGSEDGWSVVTGFSTYDPEQETTSFVIVGDAQLHGSGNAEDQEAIKTLMNIGAQVAGYDFGIQTGDYVDGGTNFAQWSQILGVWQDAFPGIDFVKAMGNHETNNANGSNISAAIYGLGSGENAYWYSVEYGNVYVAVINQHANLIEAAAWLVEDAAQSDATWKIVVCHQPPYYTNPGGSSDGHHNILAPACDEAGIDFVFSGHDHSYARTEQVSGETALALTLEGDHYVNENGVLAATKGMGTVYMISGDLGEKSRENSYKAQNPNGYPFAKMDQTYDSLYLTVEADEGHFTVTAWNMHDNGTAEVLDTFTVYDGAGVCAKLDEHDLPEDTVKYDPDTGKLICERCGEQVDPAEALYTGFAENVNGADAHGDYQYYFLAGVLQTGTYEGSDGQQRWIPYADIFLYADENGLLDHTVENWGDASCIKDGRNRAYSPRYDVSYASGASQFTGHHYVVQEDGSLVCDKVNKDAEGNEYVCGNVAIDVADWDYYLGYKTRTYDGTAHTWNVHIVNPETGEELTLRYDGITNEMTDFRRLWSDNRYVGTASVDVYFPSSGDMPTGNYYNSNGTVTLTLEIRPDNPTNITATANEDYSVTLNWTHALAKKSVGCELTYVVYYSADGGDTWKTAGTTDGTSYTVTGLNASVEYQFRIRSCGVVDGKTYNATTYTDPVSVTAAGGKALNEEYTVIQSWTKITYAGTPKTYPEAKLMVIAPDGTVLQRGTDYTVTYTDNVNVGTAKGTITGIGEYEGTLEFTFEIMAQSISTGAAVADSDAVYSPDGAETSFTVTDQNGLTLTEGEDYTVTYSENTAVGTGTATITGTGNYKDTLTVTFTIIPADISGMTVTAPDTTYTGSELTPDVTVPGLTQGVDFDVEAYGDNVNVGTATVTVTGKGNYTGTATGTFAIVPADIADAEITDRSTYSYTGSAISADISVTGVSGVLEEGVDYEIVSTVNNVNVGTATVTIRGIGNYTGETTHDFVIQSADITGLSMELEPKTYVYNGTERKPAVTVTDSYGNVLVKGTDYDVAYANNKYVGTATVTVTAKGNYTGTLVDHFEIAQADLTACTVTLSQTTYTYGSSEKTPTVTVTTATGTQLTEGKSYTVTYVNNVNAGTATVYVTGINNYAGTQAVNFTIKHQDMSKSSITVNNGELVTLSDGTTVPQITVRSEKGTKLHEGQNYTVDYALKNGKLTITVTGINNWAGTVSTTIDARTDLSGYKVTQSWTKITYSGTSKAYPEDKLVVTAPDGTVLKRGTDYTVSYSNNVNVGTATVTITGKGEYMGTITAQFEIKAVDLSSCTVDQKWTTITYSGTAKTYPADKLVLTDANGNTLVRGTDYTVSYINNVNVGTATVVITGMGNYTGVQLVTFTIRPVAPANVKASNVTKTGVKVTFTPNDDSLGQNAADKYYIYVDGKYVGCRTTSDYYDVTGLTAGTTYKITVVAVKVIDGVNFKSAATAVTVTTNS